MFGSSSSTSDSRPVLSFRDVVVSFADGDSRITPVNHVDLDIAHGELVAITGPSGSGKSTLLATAATLHTPDSGSILLDGEEIVGVSKKEAARIRREQLGIIFQQSQLIPSLTAVEQLEATYHLGGKKNGKKSKQEIRAQALELLERLDLADAANRKPQALSGGQRQRVNIARALMHQPQLLLVDEPTSALDSQRSALVMELLLDIVRSDKIGTILVTHDDYAAAQADRQLEMKDGHLTVVEKALVG